MSPWAGRLIALLAGVTVAGTLAATGLPRERTLGLLQDAKNAVWPDAATRANQRRWELDRQLDAVAEAKHVLAKVELERLGPHPWAGTYRPGGYAGHALTIVPDAGFIVYESNHCGNCSGWRASGTVVDADGLQLTLELEHGWALHDDLYRVRPSWLHLDGALYFVPWGDLMFAVVEDGMAAFCESASRREFPSAPCRNVRTNDWEPGRDLSQLDPPPGLPEVPETYRHLLPD